MISKEKFVKNINFIKHQRECQDGLCDALEKCCPGDYVCAYIYGEYEERLVEMLHDALGLTEKDDILELWMYDYDFGRTFKVGDIIIGGKKIDIDTAEKLYDYIVGEYNV